MDLDALEFQCRDRFIEILERRSSEAMEIQTGEVGGLERLSGGTFPGFSDVGIALRRQLDDMLTKLHALGSVLY